MTNKMISRIFPCISKHHGSLRCFKYVISTVRQKGFNSKKPAAVILASPSSSLSSIKEESYEIKTKDFKVKSVIGNEEASSSGKELESVDKHFVKNELKSETVDSEQHGFFKTVIKPDVTAGGQKYVENTESETDNVRVIKLLNAVKPSDLEWHKQILNASFIPKYYKGLSKFRLSGLVVITTLAGYGMAPGPLEPVTLLCMVLGTGLTSAAANAINQVLEVPYDSQMARTKNRVLIRGLVTPIHAFTFALCSASVGLSTLYFGTTPLTAILGATNLVLYTSVYTPLKRCSIVNTWLGSVVGAIPPLMGWAACTGTLNSGAFLMGAILYAWQFPHFNALSWNLRPDYSRAGYRMTSVIDPALCRRTALRHSVLMLVLCSVAPLVDLTTWTFAFDSLPLNCYLIYCSWKFYKKGDSQSSRKLFRLSLIHLPTLMFLMFVGKKYSSKKETYQNENL